MRDEPTRRDGEPSMVFRGRLMYWHFDAPDGRPYEALDIQERGRWTMLASGMERIVAAAPRIDPEGGFTPHAGGPGIVSPATFDNTAP